ncbi:hypothetical protein Tco_0919770 [Tanacetum coccineum]
MLLYTVLQVDRVFQTMCNTPLREYSLLPLVGSPLCTNSLKVLALLAFEDVPLCYFCEYSTISWMATFASAAVLVGMAPLESRICLIIMVNVIPPDHVDGVPVVEPNQHGDVLVIPEHVLVDEDEDPKEEEFEEEEEPQEEEDDMEVDIEEDENEQEMAYPYEEVDPLNPSPPASVLRLRLLSEVEGSS